MGFFLEGDRELLNNLYICFMTEESVIKIVKPTYGLHPKLIFIDIFLMLPALYQNVDWKMSPWARTWYKPACLENRSLRVAGWRWWPDYRREQKLSIIVRRHFWAHFSDRWIKKDGEWINLKTSNQLMLPLLYSCSFCNQNIILVWREHSHKKGTCCLQWCRASRIKLHGCQPWWKTIPERHSPHSRVSYASACLQRYFCP